MFSLQKRWNIPVYFSSCNILCFAKRVLIDHFLALLCKLNWNCPLFKESVSISPAKATPRHLELWSCYLCLRGTSLTCSSLGTILLMSSVRPRKYPSWRISTQYTWWSFFKKYQKLWKCTLWLWSSSFPFHDGWFQKQVLGWNSYCYPAKKKSAYFSEPCILN